MFALGLSFDRPKKQRKERADPDPEEKRKYQEEANQFAMSLVEGLGDQDGKLLASGRNIVGCYMLHPFSHPVACYCTLFGVVAQSLKPIKHLSQQLSTFLSFRDHQSIAQQCWIHVHSSSNIVGATCTHYRWFTKSYGLYPSLQGARVAQW